VPTPTDAPVVHAQSSTIGASCFHDSGVAESSSGEQEHRRNIFILYLVLKVPFGATETPGQTALTSRRRALSHKHHPLHIRELSRRKHVEVHSARRGTRGPLDAVLSRLLGFIDQSHVHELSVGTALLCIDARIGAYPREGNSTS